MYDLTIIGGGPAGYVGAIRAAQLGAKVAVVEAKRAGGTCLNVGCIPSKALLKTAQMVRQLQGAATFGVETGEVKIDFAKVMERQAQVVDNLVSGIDGLLKANGVTYYNGRGSILSPGMVGVQQENGTVEQIMTKRILVATGSRPATPPIEGLDRPGVVNSDTIWGLRELPKRMVVIGGGVIGLEVATMFASFGTEVTVVEFLPSILATADAEMAKRMGPLLRRQGIKTMTNTKVVSIEEGLTIKVEAKGAESTLEADVVMVSTGRVPNTEIVEGLGIQVERHGIVVDDSFETGVKGIYAVGDVIGGGLAHVASAQAIAAVEGMFGEGCHYDGRSTPNVVFTMPELAWVGLTEEQAKAQGLEYKVSKVPFSAIGKAQVNGEPEGTVKLLATPEGKLLGLHILGAHASDLIHEGALAIQVGATVQDLAKTIHAHPTLAEGVLEAALGFFDGPIHIARR